MDNLVARIIKHGDIEHLVTRIIKRDGTTSSTNGASQERAYS
jgi:hypothetical protein